MANLTGPKNLLVTIATHQCINKNKSLKSLPWHDQDFLHNHKEQIVQIFSKVYEWREK